LFKNEIVNIRTEDSEVKTDETIRPSTTCDSLGNLKPSFRTDEASARFPETEWLITAGNSSQITDGASAILITSERAAPRLGLRARARFVGFDVCGDDPVMMLTAPIPATSRVLRKTGLSLEKIDHYEVNEAFAPVPLAWQKSLGADPERLNRLGGGAIALDPSVGDVRSAVDDYRAERARADRRQIRPANDVRSRRNGQCHRY
jgi:acetyl-CoA acetyltransferase